MPLHSTLSSIDHYRAVGPVLRLAIPAAGRQETLSAIQSPSVSLALLIFEVLANPKSALKTPTNIRLDDEQFFWLRRGVASSRVEVIRERLPDHLVFYFIALDLILSFFFKLNCNSSQKRNSKQPTWFVPLLALPRFSQAQAP